MAGRPQNRPIPIDWASRCSVMGVRALRNHYRCRTASIWRWAEESGIEPIQSRSRPKMTPPDDFAHHAAREAVSALMARYDCSDNVIYRWRKMLGIKGPTLDRSHLRKVAPPEFTGIAPTMTKEALAARFGVCWDTITRWLAAAGVEPKARPKPNRSPRPSLAVTVGADVSAAGQAAQHLRRIMPVFKASVLAKDRTGYVVGGRQMATEEMVAMAQAKGFDPDAWRRVA